MAYMSLFEPDQIHLTRVQIEVEHIYLEGNKYDNMRHLQGFGMLNIEIGLKQQISMYVIYIDIKSDMFSKFLA